MERGSALKDPETCLNRNLSLPKCSFTASWPSLNKRSGSKLQTDSYSQRLRDKHRTEPFWSGILTFIMLTASCLTRLSSCWRRRRSSSLALSTAFICSSISAFILLCASSDFWAVLKAFSSSSKAIIKTAGNKYLKKYYHWPQVFHNQLTGSKSSCSRTG